MIFEEKTLESEMIYRGSILNLRKDKVTVKTGTSYREIVEHHGGAAVAALTRDGKIVMVRQFRKTVEGVQLEVPAGKVEIGEDPAVTVRRELKEETGYTAGQFHFLTAMEPSVGYTTERIYIYFATDLTPGETHFDENEAIDIVEYDFQKAYQMVLRGEITDGKSIVAILMTKLIAGMPAT